MSVCCELSQESENALAIKIRDQILEKIKNCKDEEELQETLLKILGDEEINIDVEKIQKGEKVSLLLDNFVACSLDSNPDNLDNTQIQLGSLLNNAISLVCNPPTFTIPYPYPVVDISGDFAKKILLALLRLAIKILLSILKKLLSLVIDVCGSGLSTLNGYGTENIANIIKRSIGEEIGDSFIGDVFKAFGYNTDGTAAIITRGDEVPCDEDSTFQEAVSNIKSVSKFLDDISLMATPVELCSLLNGRANDQTITLVEELIEFEYPTMRVRLNTKNKIIDLFKTLGQRNDPSICEIIEQNADTILSAPDACFTEDVKSLRESLLKDKKFTNDEIQNLLNKERERNRKNLQKLAELGSAVRNNPNSLLGTPQLFCKGNERGIVQPDDMPSLKEDITNTTNILFNTFATVFQKNSFDFTQDIISLTVTPNTNQKIIKKFTDLVYVDNNNEIQVVENSLNPKFMEKIASGQYTLCDQNGNTDKERLLDYYDYEVNNNNIVSNGTIDVQTLINTTNYSAFDDDKNVYIINFDYVRKVTPDVMRIANNSNDYLTVDYDKMSINLSVPNKYVSRSNTSNEGSFNVLPNAMNISIFTISGSNS
jgi:predicted transcriptional regulator